MPQDRNAQLAEAERAELERLVQALARWPRLSALLRYMGEKYFSGNAEQLNEYNIATDVLGRSKTVFNAAEDAITRVEAHRLRKRLAAFYETEGRGHLIQVTLPAGSYVPAFIHRSAAERGAEEPSPKPVSARPGALGKWYWVLTASLVLAAAGAYLHLRSVASPARAKPASRSVAESVPPGFDASALSVRLLAGYSGPPRSDSAGTVWHPDRYFSGGGTWRRAPGFIGRASDSFLFDYSRTGDFSYDIPLKPGSYELHLFFSTPVRVNEGAPSFTVWINGNAVLQGFDINADALGENIADECVFRDVSPGENGFLRLGFSSVTGPPTLNAVEILPGLPHKQLPIRLIMQTTPFTDHKGRVWHPDDYFMNGRLSYPTRPLLDSPDPDLFSTERYGHFTYAIPVDRRDSYTLILHFAELYFGPGASGNGGVGSRIFKVMCNGETLLNNFDIFKEAGSLHEVAKTFRHLKPSAQGKLNLTFEPISNNATVSGIEVLDESQ